MPDLILREVDPDEFRRAIAADVANAVRDVLAEESQPKLVDRVKMAELASIGTATLDGLVKAGKIPSVTVGRRRLFEPRKVIDAMA